MRRITMPGRKGCGHSLHNHLNLLSLCSGMMVLFLAFCPCLRIFVTVCAFNAFKCVMRSKNCHGMLSGLDFCVMSVRVLWEMVMTRLLLYVFLTKAVFAASALYEMGTIKEAEADPYGHACFEICTIKQAEADPYGIHACFRSLGGSEKIDSKECWRDWTRLEQRCRERVILAPEKQRQEQIRREIGVFAPDREEVEVHIFHRWCSEILRERWNVTGLQSSITGKSLWATVLDMPRRKDSGFAKNPALDNVVEQFVDALSERKGLESFWHNDDCYLTPPRGWFWWIGDASAVDASAAEEVIFGRIRMFFGRNTAIEGVPDKKGDFGSYLRILSRT